jgi:hypothetical protein
VNKFVSHKEQKKMRVEIRSVIDFSPYQSATEIENKSPEKTKIQLPTIISLKEGEYNTNSTGHQLYKTVMTGNAIEIEKAVKTINSMADAAGLKVASIQDHYEAKSKGAFKNVTVPAINCRLLTPLMVASVIKTNNEMKTPADQPIIFELAKSESGYTLQNPAQFAALVKLGYLLSGVKNRKVYIQGDHYQVDKNKFWKELKEANFSGPKAKLDNEEIYMLDMERDAMSPEEQKAKLRKTIQFLDKSPAVQDIVKLCKNSILAGYRNIDIDSSVLERENGSPYLKQEWNGMVSGYLMAKIRSFEKELGIKEPISIGGEIGEIGKSNTTKEDFEVYLSIMKKTMDEIMPGLKGPSKFALTTGTAHGGVRDKDGKLLRVVPISFDIHEKFAGEIKNPWIPGSTRIVTVQHGASTLDPDLYKGFSGVGVGEIHLATEYQNIILEVIKQKDPETYEKLLNSLLTDEKLSSIKSQKQKYPAYKTTDKAKYLADKDTVKSVAGAGDNAKTFLSLKSEIYVDIMNALTELFTKQFNNLRLNKGNQPLSAEEIAIKESVIKANKEGQKKVKLVATED